MILFFYKKRVQFIKKQERAKAEVQKRMAETKMESIAKPDEPILFF
jgi:hypothetical protein